MRPNATAFDAAELHRPGDLQPFDIASVNLVEGREALSAVILMMGDPVLLLLVGVQETLSRGLRTLGHHRRFRLWTDRRGVSSKGCRGECEKKGRAADIKPAS